MSNYKLIKTLLLLEKKEMDSLIEFSSYELFSKNKAIGKLLLYLRGRMKKNNWTKKECYNHVFSNGEFDDVRLRQLFSATLKLVEDFIAFYQLKKKPYLKSQVLSDFYKDELEADLFEHHNKKIENNIQSLDFNAQYLERMKLACSRMEFSCTEVDYHLENSYKYKRGEIIQEQIKSFNEMVVVLAMNLCVSYFSSKVNIITIQSDIEERDLFSQLIQLLLSEKYNFLDQFNEQVAVGLNYYQYKLYLNPEDEESYLFLKKIIDDPKNKEVPSYDLYGCYITAKYFNTMKYKKTGNMSFLKTHMIMNQDLLDKKLIFHKGNIFTLEFHIIFRLLMQNGYLEKAEAFLEKYRNKIDEKYRSFIYNYCGAQLNFQKNDFEASLKQIHEMPINKKYPLYFASKRLELQVFYELGEWDVLESKINAFKVLLSRDRRIATKRKAGYKEFANLVLRLIRMDDKKIQKFKKQVLSKRPFIEDAWMVEKIEQRFHHAG